MKLYITVYLACLIGCGTTNTLTVRAVSVLGNSSGKINTAVVDYSVGEIKEAQNNAINKLNLNDGSAVLIWQDDSKAIKVLASVLYENNFIVKDRDGTNSVIQYNKDMEQLGAEDLLNISEAHKVDYLLEAKSYINRATASEFFVSLLLWPLMPPKKHWTENQKRTWWLHGFNAGVPAVIFCIAGASYMIRYSRDNRYNDNTEIGWMIGSGIGMIAGYSISMLFYTFGD